MDLDLNLENKEKEGLEQKTSSLEEDNGINNSDDSTEKKSSEAQDDTNSSSNADLIELPNGEKISLDELKSGYMRQDDYSRKAQELSEHRKQLELARKGIESGNVSNKEKRNLLDTLEDQQKELEDALGALDEYDPQAKVLKGIYRQNAALIGYVREKEKMSEEANNKEQYEEKVKHFQKLTDNELDENAKSYSLPKLKSPEGRDIDFSTLWREQVLSTISRIDKPMTIPEYRQLIKKVGAKTYERLRDIISAISADVKKTPKEPRAAVKTDAGNPHQDNKRAGLTLSDRLTKAFSSIKGE